MKVAVTTLAFCVTSLLALGLVMLYSASMTQAGAHYLMMQLVWCLAGGALCVTAACLDYQVLKKVVLPLFLFSLVLLVLVMLPLPHGLTKKINGAHRWFILPGIRLQPSELAKIALILALAWYGEHFHRRMHEWKKGLLYPMFIAGIMLALIFREPDWGTTCLLASVSLGMLLLAGADWRKMMLPVPVAVAGLVYFALHDPVRLKRICSWLDPEQTKDGVGYQTYQSVIAFGSGGWTGLGLGNGRQKLGFVPEHHTDFIFSIIGEELGLIATLAVILVFVVLTWCGFYIASRAKDTFGMLLAVGITLLISLQAVINIGVVTGAFPNKGLPLPFISYGGSNMLAMMVCVGLLFSVARQASAAKASVADFVSKSHDNPFAAKAA